MAGEMTDRPLRRSLDQWQIIVRRFGASDLSVTQFCAQEGVSQARLNHWRRRLGTGGPGLEGQQGAQRAEFIDAGVLGSPPTADGTGGPVTVRIDLGAGVLLSVWRG